MTNLPVKTFRIAPHPMYGFITVRTPSRQHLVGLIHDERINVEFDSLGKLLSVQADKEPAHMESYRDPDLLSNCCLQALGNDAQVIEINVLEFSVPGRPIAIHQLPDYLSDLSHFRTADDGLQEELDEWMENNGFVLNWGAVFFMDEDGSVGSS